MAADTAPRRVIVTGGSSGLGAAVCERLTAAGANVVSLDRAPNDAVTTIAVDLADRVATEAATQAAITCLGGVDAVVCSAGMDVPGAFGDVPGATWDRIIAVNLAGTAAVIRSAMSALEQVGGHVVTVASTLGHRVAGDATAYCASKFGVVGFTRALAMEYRGRVAVTLLTPGGMHTAFFDDRPDQYRPPPEAALADPRHVADAVLWVLAQPAGVEVKEIAIMAPGESSWP